MDRPDQEWSWCKACKSGMKVQDVETHIKVCHDGDETAFIKGDLASSPKPTADELATESFTLAVAIKDSVDQWQKQILMNHMLDQEKRGKPVGEQMDTYKSLLPQ